MGRVTVARGTCVSSSRLMLGLIPQQHNALNASFPNTNTSLK